VNRSLLLNKALQHLHYSHTKQGRVHLDGQRR
jgi:hypothetical protein